MALSSEQKKALKKEYLKKMNRKYILKKGETKKLFNYIIKNLETENCNHTLKYTLQWLGLYVEDEKRRNKIIEEIKEMGGFCDCEVILNCYERYELL